MKKLLCLLMLCMTTTHILPMQMPIALSMQDGDVQGQRPVEDLIAGFQQCCTDRNASCAGLTCLSLLGAAGHLAPSVNAACQGIGPWVTPVVMSLI